MTNPNPKTALEADIAEERTALADTLASLADGFKPKAMIENWEESAPEIAQKAMTAAKENPLAIGAIGAGLAILAYGASKQSDPKGVAFDINGEADPVKTKIAETKYKVTQTAAEMRDAVYDGTSELSDLARARIVAARSKAADAQARIEQTAQAATAQSRDVFQRYPLAICAGIAAIGAAVAYSLPRTKVEDDAFGAQRDALVDQAEAIFHQEAERAMAQGREAVDAAQTALHASAKIREDATTTKPH